MENASKALIMAGGVLIALMVIGILVVFFNNLSDLQRIEQSSEETEQIAEFNKQYDVYARDVYGSELLSIANKIDDYNKRESTNKGYSKIELEVNIKYDMDKDFFNKNIYTASSLKTEIENLENKIKEIGNISIKSATNSRVSRKVSQLATMRTADIEELEIIRTDYSESVTQYNTYKTLLTEIKAKVFKYVEFKYDKNTGRVIKMIYEI